MNTNKPTMDMSSREHRRANKHEREKTVRDTIKRYKRLHRARYWEPVYEELEKPEFWGYSREFVLRSDVALRNDASKWRALLDLVQNVEYSKRKDFKKKIWPSRRRTPQEHLLKTFCTEEFHRIVPWKFQVHFRYYYADGRRRYYFLHSWMFVTRTRKSYNTHRRVVDLDLERELSYLGQRIEQNLYWQAWSRQKKGGFNSHYNRVAGRNKLRDKLHQAEMREALLMRDEGEEPFTINT